MSDEDTADHIVTFPICWKNADEHRLFMINSRDRNGWVFLQSWLTCGKKLKRRRAESNLHKRHWFSPVKAAKLIEEQELSRLLKDLPVVMEPRNAA